MTQRYAVIDLETTGNSPKKGDRIIQFAAVIIEDDNIVDEYSTYIRPEQSISLFIEELTGIDNDMVEDAPVFEEVAGKIFSILEDSVFVAHNVLFDLSFLKEEMVRSGYEPFYGSAIDTVELAKILKPTSDGYKLNQLAREENLEHERPHRADSDAYVTALLLLEFKKKLKSLPVMTLKQLYKHSFSLKSEISEMIDECLNFKLAQPEKHNPDLETFRGLAFRKIDGESHAESEIPDYPMNEQEKMKLIAHAFPLFEKRNGQLNMMDNIYQSFQSSRHCIIEAGTGIGKSLGYLLPAAYFAKSRRKNIIVSTYTLQLQEQLLHKELPQLKKILPFPIHAVLLKGRGNYLSLAKFERSLRQKDDNYETALTKMQILVWLTETETGDRDELHLTSGGQLFWERLQSDEFTYQGLQLPWQKRDFYTRARAIAEKADIIITNHSFLMADLISKNSGVAGDGYLILDEAHHFEKAASRHLGRRLDYITVKTMLNRLGTYEQKQLFYKIEKMASKRRKTDLPLIKSFNAHISDFFYEFEQLFYFLARQAEKLTKNGSTDRLPIDSNENWKQASFLTERLIQNLNSVMLELENRINLVKNSENPAGKNSLFYLNDAEVLLKGIEDIKQTLHEFFIKRNEDSIYWLDYTKAGPHQGISLSSQPISGSKILWDDYFSRQQSVIMTSATLSVKQSFAFFKAQLGIEDKQILAVSYPSPFNYKEKVKILVPSAMPDVASCSKDEFAEAAAHSIIHAAKAAKGRMMVLFTSHDMLRNVYQKVKDSGSLQEFTLFAQGISGGSKMKLIRNFQTFDKALLFGTTSLWEGVDIPGESLSCLAIVRLPFSPPDEPVTAARCALLEKRGINAFSAYSLPQAILRFRQGFGRLIRTSTDRGILLILDKRVMTSRYGREFKQSLPPAEWLEVTQEEMIGTIENWI
ncbi:ATP-dependent DNA helicase DinG [Actinomycetes bacterium NPDC127524]